MKKILLLLIVALTNLIEPEKQCVSHIWGCSSTPDLRLFPASISQYCFWSFAIFQKKTLLGYRKGTTESFVKQPATVIHFARDIRWERRTQLKKFRGCYNCFKFVWEQLMTIVMKPGSKKLNFRESIYKV